MSNQDAELVSLIKKAGLTVGSEYKLAQLMGIPQQTLSNWKAGDRTCTPEDRARLAGFANEDALQELVRSTLKKHEGTRKGEQLFQLLGKSLLQTGGASVSGLLTVASAACLTTTQTVSELIRCIEVLSPKRVFSYK